MPKRKSRGKKSVKVKTPSASFDNHVERFGDEVGALGKKIGKKGEEFGKRFEKNADLCCGGRGPLGALGLLLSVIIGVLGIALSTWALRFLAEKTGSSILYSLHDFLLANLGIFITIFLLSALLNYLSGCCRSGYVVVSPISTAFGFVVFLWIAANTIIISNTGLGIRTFSQISEYVLGHLWPIFLIVLLIGYFLMISRIFFGSISKYSCGEIHDVLPQKKRSAPGPKRLYRSGNERILGGVCGGIAEYLGVDPVLIRLIWAIAVFFYGTGVILYIICWIIIPRNPYHE